VAFRTIEQIEALPRDSVEVALIILPSLVPELASGLDPTRPHEVVVMREAEANAGVHELLGVLVDVGALSVFKLEPRIVFVEGAIGHAWRLGGQQRQHPHFGET